MKFLKEETLESLTSFEKILLSLQTYFIQLYSIMCRMEENNFDSLSDYGKYMYPIAEESMFVPGLRRTASFDDRLAHSVFRCWTSRTFFERIFSLQDTTSWFVNTDPIPGNIIVSVISLGGAGGFPDHTFILIHYDDVAYIMQSYYYSYTVSGKYGLLKLSLEDYNFLKFLIDEYYKQTIENDIEYIKKINNLLQFFTGVDSSRHGGDNSQKYGDNNIKITNYSTSPYIFANILENRLYTLTNICYGSVINISINYRSYDAFIDFDEKFSLIGIHPDMVKEDHYVEIEYNKKKYSYIPIEYEATITNDSCNQIIYTIYNLLFEFRQSGFFF